MGSHQALAGKTAVVTGASSGIGRAIAERLGAAGAHVFLSGRTRDAMDEAKGRIAAAGGKATVIAGDVRDTKHVRELIDTAMRETKRLDVMVNNAGVSFPRPIVDGDPDLAAGALREAREESGLTRLALVSPEVFDVDRHRIPARGAEPEHWHYDVRFLIEADPDEPLAISSESKDLAWVPLAGVARLNPDESMLRMVRKSTRRA